MTDSPNRATLRRKTEVALAHTRAANEMLDSIVNTQSKWNAALAKLDADTGASLDQNYSDTAGSGEITSVTTVSDIVNVNATASWATSAAITLTDATSGGATRNTQTVTLQVLAAAANPTDKILADWTGTINAIIITITPNDGTNNSATPVDMTTAELVEYINTGDIAAKTGQVTETDVSGFRGAQTTTGGDATDLVDAGEGDGLVATFASGITADLLDGTFFILQETAGSVAFWIDTDNSGTTIPGGATAADRAIEITTVSGGDSANTVAGLVATAIDDDAAFAAPAPGAAIITVTNAVGGAVPDAEDGNTGFTVAPTSKGSDSLVISDLFEADDEQAGAQHKQTIRKSLRSAIAHKKLADEIADSIEEMQAANNAVLAKLDAEAGTLNDADYEDTLTLSVIDDDGEGSEAQHKQSLRKSLRSAMANKRAADQIMDAIKAMQESFNAAMVVLDTGSINGAMATFQVTALDPDAE